MDKNRQKKLLLGMGGVVFLLCMILGALAYHQSPQGGQQETTTATPTQPSLPSGDKGDSSIHPSGPEVQLMGAQGPNVNEITVMALLGCLWGLSRLANINETAQTITFAVHTWHKILTVVVVIGIVGGYLGCFWYQKYKVAHKDFKNDMGLIGLASVVTSAFWSGRVFGWLEGPVTSDVLLGLLESKVIFCLHLSLWEYYLALIVVYLIAIKAIERYKSNANIKIETSYVGVLPATMLILNNIWAIMEVSAKWPPIITILLRILSVCFVYVQAFWAPKLPAIGPKNILGMIVAWLFSSTHFLVGLNAMFYIYYFNPRSKKINIYNIIFAMLVPDVLWFILSCFKWDFLYHLEIKKALDTGGYTVSFPLSVDESLKDALMILFGIYGPLQIYFSEGLLQGKWARMLCVAMLLMGGLRMKMFLRRTNIVPQWMFGLLEYLYVGIVAVYYLRYPPSDNDGFTKYIVGLGSVLLLVLYVIPRCLHYSATAYLASKNTSEFWQKIAHVVQHVSACWLQLSIKQVLCIGLFAFFTEATRTAEAASIVQISTISSIFEELKKLLTLKKILTLKKLLQSRVLIQYFMGYLAVALGLHLLLQYGFLGFLGSGTAHTHLLYGWALSLILYSEWEYSIPSDILRAFDYRGVIILSVYAIHRLTAFMLTRPKTFPVLQTIAGAIQRYSPFRPVERLLYTVYTSVSRFLLGLSAFLKALIFIAQRIKEYQAKMKQQ